jgi:hypothetical protein
MTAEPEPSSRDDASTPSLEVSGQSTGVDLSGVDLATLTKLLRAVIARLRESPTSDSAASGPLLAGVHGPLAAQSSDHIYSHESDDVPFLSVLLVANDTSDTMLNDALLSLDAQSDTDFELIVVVSASLGIDRDRVEELLGEFSSGLAARSHVVIETSESMAQRSRTDALRAGLAQARGCYVAVLDATSVVFAHFVETFAHMSQASPAGVLRARAIAQPLRTLTWPDGSRGFEPTGGAAPASASRFSALEHLLSSVTASPPGSYALRRGYVDELGLHDDEVTLLVEAAMLGGVHEAPDEVIVLLRHFEG